MAQLYDHKGDPVDLGRLKQEEATASVTSGIRSPLRDTVASTLTPMRLGRLIREADDGELESYLTLAEEMEEREWHYRSVLGNRKLALAGANINVEAADDSEEEQAIADAVRQDITETPAFRDMLIDMMDALGKGYCAVETLWDTEGARWKPRGYRWRDPRFFVFDRDSLTSLRLRTETSMSEGEELPPFKYIQHVPKLKSGLPLRGGLARIAAAAYMCKAFTIRDWLTFMEVFGVPFRVGKYDPGANAAEQKKLLNAVRNIAVDAAGIIPKNMDIEFITARGGIGGGEKLFSGAAAFFDEQVSKAVLGQTMTTDNGSSLAQARVHENVLGMLVDSDCWQGSATLNRDLVRPYVDLNYGTRQRYPAVRLYVEEPEDDEKSSRVLVNLVEAGAQIPEYWVREKFGYPEPQDGDVLLGGKVQGQPDEPPPEPPGNAEDEDEDEDEDEALARAHNREGERNPERDQVEDVMREMLYGEWEPVLDDVVGEITRIATAAQGPEDFRRMLEAADLNIDALTKHMAVAFFTARGAGDAADEG